MGVCKSKAPQNTVKQPQSVSVTTNTRRPDRASTANQQKITTVQFQEPTSIQRISTPVRMASPNQTSTPVRKLSPNNNELPLRKASSSHQTPQTVIVQPLEKKLYEGGSLLNIPAQRSSLRQSSKNLQSPASRNYSIVSNQLKEKLGPTVMQHNETGQLVSVELLKHENRNQQYIDMLEEIKFDNMHIVKLIDIHIDSHNRQHQVIYEHCPGGKLSKLLSNEKLTVEQVGRILYQMVDAIAYLHHLGYSHDELTIDSFSIFDDINAPYIKLSDIRSIFQFMYPKNSILYEPPNSPNHHIANKNSRSSQRIQQKERNLTNDVWALGIITIELLTQSFPFQAEEIHHFDPEAFLQKYQGDINSLLVRMLKRDPKERFTLEQCLGHTFMIQMKQVQPKDFLKPLHNIIKCSKITQLHKCLFQYLLSTFASDHMKVLAKLFSTADMNQDGSLSKEELYNLFSVEGANLVDQLDLSKGMTMDQFILFASDKELILSQNCIESSFKTFAKSQQYITPKAICKVIPETDEEVLQKEFDLYNLHSAFYFEEYEKFLLNYESPKPFS